MRPSVVQVPGWWNRSLAVYRTESLRRPVRIIAQAECLKSCAVELVVEVQCLSFGELRHHAGVEDVTIGIVPEFGLLGSSYHWIRGGGMVPEVADWCDVEARPRSGRRGVSGKVRVKRFWRNLGGLTLITIGCFRRPDVEHSLVQPVQRCPYLVDLIQFVLLVSAKDPCRHEDAEHQQSDQTVHQAHTTNPISFSSQVLASVRSTR